MRLPVFGNVARVALWGGFCLGACCYRRLERFWQMYDSENNRLKKRTNDPYVLRLIAVSPPKSG